ncbi:tetratricopeptide repeat protein [Paenibacillus allorhizosphaerae]|uniref:Beta-barrel assembly-enhancing protease n=1 Tax=Paenibacillus allorhizosphaerae TaxID=2849866 RepID=A0ABN7TXR8_9BACL|nr:tetratricopeptide repeat protein [Paenibacillus allorhizosphaerae]CAG7656048.1 Beta-barrel assembly-enhancing protease [Paenibacillus allorhizosphaerae]
MKENKLALLLLPLVLIAGFLIYWFTTPTEVQPDADSRYNQALAFIQQNRLDEAKILLESGIADKPQEGKYDFQLGNIARKQNHADEAYKLYEAAAAKTPQLVEAYNNMAALKMVDNKLDEALTVIESGLKQQPDFKDLQFKKGQILYIKGDYVQAETVLKSLLGDLQYVEAARFLGLSLLKQNRTEEALVYLKEYINKSPADSKGKEEIQKIINDLEKTK